EKICEAVLYHHENFDGSGYPENLSGEEIPLGARIIRVCDVFAALTSDRPYRKHFSIEDALQLMIDEITNFDMKIFLAFNRVAHRVGISYHRDLTNEELYTLICAFPHWEEVFCFGGHTPSLPEEILKKDHPRDINL
ncbi:MAG: HD-GYP domain-containing protein, partial [Lachnospiraceae bacterium]